MKLATVILNFNDSETTKHLHTLIKGFCSIDNIVIVDNLSTDGSYEKLKCLEDDKTRVIQSQRNAGYGYGNNYGIQFARTKLGATHALIANPDVEFSEDTVIALKEVFTRNKNLDDCAVVAPIIFGTEGEIRAWKLPSVKELILESGIVYSHFFPQKYYTIDQLKDEVCEVDVVVGAMLMVDIAKMMKMHVYDEQIFLFEEENLLGYQCKKFGYHTYLLPKCECIHNHSTSIKKSIKSRARILSITLESKMVLLKKYYHINCFIEGLSRLYFKYCVLELYVVDFILRR